MTRLSDQGLELSDGGVIDYPNDRKGTIRRRRLGGGTTERIVRQAGPGNSGAPTGTGRLDRLGCTSPEGKKPAPQEIERSKLACILTWSSTKTRPRPERRDRLGQGPGDRHVHPWRLGRSTAIRPRGSSSCWTRRPQGSAPPPRRNGWRKGPSPRACSRKTWTRAPFTSFASGVAADINNGGLEEQVRYLVERLGTEHAEQRPSRWSRSG